MNNAKASLLIGPAIDLFSDLIGEQFSVRIYLINKNEIGEERNKIFSELDAKYEGFSSDCSSETVVGNKGTAILIYPFNVFNSRDLTHCVLHECGHKYFRDVNPELVKKYNNGVLKDSVHMGFTLFEEFIAEVLANYAETETAYFDDEIRRAQLVHLLYSAIPGINREPTIQAMNENAMFMRTCVYVLPSDLGRYAAMLLTDPTLVQMRENDPNYERGFAATGKAIQKEIESLILLLTSYLNSYYESAFVDEDLLEKIGKKLINIWQIRSEQKTRA